MNRYYRLLFLNPSQKLTEKIKVQGFSLKVQEYLIELIGTTEAFLGLNSIKAVVLFGSLVYDKISDVSDVDVLIITKYAIPKPTFQELDAILTSVEIKYSYFKIKGGFFNQLLQSIERSTGMYRSHFLCSSKDWKAKKFAKIFNTNALITRFLAPVEIVLNSVIESSLIIYGELAPKQSDFKFKPLSIFKSMLMTLLMSSGTLFTTVIRHDNLKYSLEAIKWALRTCYVYLNKKNGTLSEITHYFTSLGISRSFFDLFLAYRDHPQFDIKFLLKAPFIIMRIHILTLQLTPSF